MTGAVATGYRWETPPQQMNHNSADAPSAGKTSELGAPDYLGATPSHIRGGERNGPEKATLVWLVRDSPDGIVAAE
jgi:hypothetical protein